MSLRALPWSIFPFVLYNIIVLFRGGAVDGGAAAESILSSHLFAVQMLKGATWTFTLGDLVILSTLVALFVEIVKATYTSSASLVDHGLSMLVFIACLVEFLVMNAAATSVFFFVMVTALIDVVAGFTIGIRVARRDLSIGADH